MKNREAAYGVLFYKGSVLMCLFSRPGHERYNFPGGRIREGETHQEAVSREFLEEVGVDARAVTHLYSSNNKTYMSPDIEDTRLIYHYYLVQAEGDKITLEGNQDDVERLEWFDLENLPYEMMLEVDQDFARTLEFLD